MNRLKGGGKLPARPSVIDIVKGGLGGLIGISFLGYLSHMSGVPWLMAPFGATCVILFAAPASPLAQPRNVILGHLITSIIGLIALYAFGNSLLVLGLSVGISIMLMQLLRSVHPPAGANPIVIILAGKSLVGIDFLLFPVLLGSIVLVLIALIINNLGKNSLWPVYWHGIATRKD